MGILILDCETVVHLDEGDVVWAMQWHWDVSPDRRGGTWLKRSQNQLTFYLHRSLWERHHGALPQGMEIDHINHDSLDNRMVNLRPATRAQNAMNQRPQVGRSSRYKGVSWSKSHKRWHAYITHSGKRRYLGVFKDEKLAALAYDDAARELFGEFAYPNFA